jgi:hypothetical protein
MTLISLFILILSILPPLLLATFGYIFYKKNRILETLIFSATLIHEIILISFPCIFAVFSDFKFEKLLRFELHDYDLLKVIAVENAYILCFLLPFIFFFRKREAPWSFDNEKLYNFFAFITLIGITVYVYQIIHRPTIEEIVDSYSQSGLEGSSNKFISFFTLTFEHASIIVAAIISIRGKSETYPKLYQYLGILMLVLVLSLVIVSGVRGRVVWVAEFVLLIALLKKKYKPLLLMLLLVIALIPLNNILVTQIRPISEEIAKEGGITNKAIVNIIKTIIDGVREPSKDETNVLQSLAERAQGPRNSAVLMREHDEGRSLSPNIYTGALFYFIPRIIFNRPVIGSPNENYKDAGIFKVMELNYAEASFITMGPLLASAHAYWEGGYLGVVIIAILASFLWITIIWFCYKQPTLFGVLVVLLCCCALLIDGFISIFTPLYALIAIFWKNLLPLFLFYFMYMKLKIPKFRFK